MADRCLNGNELIKKAGISNVTLSRVWKGKEIQLKTAGKIARALEISAESIVVSEHTQQDDRNKLVDRLTGIEQELKTIKNELI